MKWEMMLLIGMCALRQLESLLGGRGGTAMLGLGNEWHVVHGYFSEIVC